MVAETISDADLAALAAGGDPDDPLPPDAVPWTGPAGLAGSDLLPEWYMPAPAPRAQPIGRWRRIVAWILIVAALAVVASGLCNTYGELVVA